MKTKRYNKKTDTEYWKNDNGEIKNCKGLRYDAYILDPKPMI